MRAGQGYRRFSKPQRADRLGQRSPQFFAPERVKRALFPLPSRFLSRLLAPAATLPQRAKEAKTIRGATFRRASFEGGSIRLCRRAPAQRVGGDASSGNRPRAPAVALIQPLHGARQCAPAAVLPFYEGEAPWALEERARTYRGPSSRRWRWSARASLDGGGDASPT